MSVPFEGKAAYWVRDFKRSPHGKWFALCWSCGCRTMIRFNNKKKALKALKCSH